MRERLAELAPELVVQPPALAALQRGKELAARHIDAERAPVLWIEVGGAEGQTSKGWSALLAAANRQREQLRSAGRWLLILAGPEELRAWVREGAPDLWTLAPPVLQFESAPRRLPSAAGGTIDWLHLSDLHLGRSADWREDAVLAHLQRDLPKLLAEAGVAPDLVFVTGDVAWSGKAEQYEIAHKFLADLLEQLELSPGESLFLIPGNHDVDRAAIGRGARLAQAQLLGMGGEQREEFRAAVGDILGSARELEDFGRRLAAYSAFTGRLLGPARGVSADRPFRTDVRDIAGVAVGVASLASSWLCGPDEDRKGRIVLGERQLRDALGELSAGGASLRIVLLHHPLEWLHEAEDRNVRELLGAEADVVLHGHLHETDLALTQSPFGRGLVSAAGALYAGAGYPHGFQAARLEPETGELTLHFFKHVDRGGGYWSVDHDLGPRARAGRMSVVLRPLLGLAPAAADISSATEALGVRLKQAVLRVYGRIDFVGLADSAPKPKTKLDELYVPASFAPAAGIEWPDALPGPHTSRAPERVTLADLEASLFEEPERSEPAGRCAVVLGDPGSGKSTLVMHLALAAAERAEAPVPLVVKLREYVRQARRDGLLAFASDECRELLQVPVEVAQLEAMGGEGRLLLLVDGLDEVVDEHDRTRVRDLLVAFAERFPRSAVLATSRVVGYDRAPLPDERFITLRLQAFSDEEIRSFIERWYHVAIPDDPRERERRSADLIAALQSEPRARELARVPLLATLIALVHRFEANLPGERAALYELCVKTLVVTWPRARGRRFAGLDEFLQRAVLEQLALQLQERRGSQEAAEQEVTIARRELVDALAELLAQRGQGASASERCALAERWVEWLQADTGLLVEQEPGVFGFLHLSLLEFLAGRALLEREGAHGDEAVARFIARYHIQPHWREPCLLALGSQSTRRTLVDATVRALLECARERSPSWHSWVFLLAVLREEVDVRPEARVEILDGAAQAAVSQVPSRAWLEATRWLSDVVRFGRRHGRAVREHLLQRLGSATGELLAGSVALLPKAVVPRPVLDARSDCASAAAALLDFGPGHEAGIWARDVATRDVVLTWIAQCPGDLVAARTLEALTGHLGRHSAAGALLVARASSWRSWVALQVPQNLVPGAVRWELPETGVASAVALLPSWVVTSSADPRLERGRGHAFAADFGVEFVRDFADYVTRRVAGLGPDVTRVLTSGFGNAFARAPRGLAPDVARVFAGTFARRFIRNFAFLAGRGSARNSPDVVRDVASGVTISAQPRLSAPNFALPSSEEGGDPLAALESARGNDRAIRAASELLVRFGAHAWAGYALASTAGLAADWGEVLATLGLQDAWLASVFEPLAQTVLGGEPSRADPTKVGLLLAVGLRQLQTQGRWPWGPTWAQLVAEPAPEHWFAGYWWHTVHALATDDPARARAAEAAAQTSLKRSDWPELAARMGEYRFQRTPPEIAMRFGTSWPASAG